MKDIFTEKIREKAKELLQTQKVECFLGYERGSDGKHARPTFVYDSTQVDRLVFDSTCVHCLVKFLLQRKDKMTGIILKGCDARALNLLLAEKQISREKVFIVGVVCPGMEKSPYGESIEELEDRCQRCYQHAPRMYDVLIGDPIEEKEKDSYPDVVEMEKWTPQAKETFWKTQFDKCIRCYACRQICPACFCTECFAERLDPEWLGIRIGPQENWMWHVVRAFHMTGRCVGCNECERTCPVGIPLSLLNRKLEKEVERRFKFKAGESPEAVGPLLTFEKDDKVGVDDK